jgi:hypothetical protein
MISEDAVREREPVAPTFLGRTTEVNTCNMFVVFIALGVGVSSFGCGGEATTSLGPTSAGESGSATVGSSGKSGEGGSSASSDGTSGTTQVGSPGSGTGGGFGVGGSPGSSAGNGGTGGDCFNVMCDLFMAPTCKDTNTLTTYGSPTPCDASCISIPIDVPCGPGKQCDPWSPTGAACVDPVAMCAQDKISYNRSRMGLVASDYSCAVDSDCALLLDNNLCNVGCGTAIAASAQPKVLSALTEIANNECGTCPPVDPPPCAQFHAVCVNNACAAAL